MKVLAMYLPQFHRVKENDEWWGEGFTDWVAARKAEPLFAGHCQPHIPLDNNYYDLLDKGTMQWQADLMKQYGVDGVCIYHYWFKDGRRILEKPAENLLEWTDIDMPFCFYWANQSWARTWSQIRGVNVWSDEGDTGQKREGNGILLEQAYGTEAQWKEHFDYMLPFFRDPRYIRVDGKPLLMIYKSIPCLDEMLSFWRKLAEESGLQGLYVIGGFLNLHESCLDAALCCEPARSGNRLTASQLQDTVKIIEYDDVWHKILNAVPISGQNIYYGGFVGYDDTPRRGKKGLAILHATPEKFGCYLTELMAKNAAHGNEIVFVNAWNEWGEGMYLEPDAQYGKAFLEQIPWAKENYKDKIADYLNKTYVNVNEIQDIQKRSNKFERYLNLLDVWMTLRENGIRLDKYLLDRGYKKIGVYGYGIFGRHLIEEMKDSCVQVVFLVDRKGDKLCTPVPVYLPSAQLPECDAIVVSSVFFIEDIRTELTKHGDYKLISLEAILKESEFQIGL